MTCPYLNEYAGRYVLVSAAQIPSGYDPLGPLPVPSVGQAFFGYLLDHSDGWCLLANAALWTQGMTKDLVRPGQPMVGPEVLPWRLGLIVVHPYAIQECGHPGASAERGTGVWGKLPFFRPQVTDAEMD